MIRFALLAALAMLAPVPASAEGRVSTGGSAADLALLAGIPEPGGSRLAALEIRLAPGWRTYWRSPGETGLPPRLDWSGSANLRGVEVLWPRPDRFESFGAESLGYSGRAILPIRLHPEDPDDPIALALAVAVGVCRDICYVEETTLTRVFAPGETGAAEAVAAARDRVPPPATEAGVTRIDCRLEGAGADRRLTARLTLDRTRPETTAVVEMPPPGHARNVAVTSEGASLHVTAEIVAEGPAAWVARAALRLTLLGPGGWSADIRGCRPAGD